jgi:hypothetical protein
MMSKARENFVRLAEARTRRALKDLRLIGNLSNRSNYSWRDDDVARIFAALDSELKAAKQRFLDAQRKKSEIEFKLD